MLYVFAQIGTRDELCDLVLRLTDIPKKGDTIVLTIDTIVETMTLMEGVTIGVLRVATTHLPVSLYALSAKILYEVKSVPGKK